MYDKIKQSNAQDIGLMGYIRIIRKRQFKNTIGGPPKWLIEWDEDVAIPDGEIAAVGTTPDACRCLLWEDSVWIVSGIPQTLAKSVMNSDPKIEWRPRKIMRQLNRNQ
jgi:hypothetical protein